MFGLSAPGGQRPAGSGEPAVVGNDAARAAFAPLVDGAHRAMRAGRLRAGDPSIVAAQFWSVLHGFVMLELAGQLRHVDDAVTHVLLPLGTHLLVGLGDTPDRAAGSVAAALAAHLQDEQRSAGPRTPPPPTAPTP